MTETTMTVADLKKALDYAAAELGPKADSFEVFIFDAETDHWAEPLSVHADHPLDPTGITIVTSS